MYTPAHLLIPPQDKLSLFRKHIPKQQEIDALLKNLRTCVLHNLMVNLDTKDLIESYTKSLRYREIYNYITDGRLPGNAITQKKIAGVQNSSTQRKRKMDPLFTFGNSREI